MNNKRTIDHTLVIEDIRMRADKCFDNNQWIKGENLIQDLLDYKAFYSLVKLYDTKRGFYYVHSSTLEYC